MGRVGAFGDSPGSSRTVFGDLNCIYSLKTFILLEYVIFSSADRITVAPNGRNDHTKFQSFLDYRNNTFM